MGYDEYDDLESNGDAFCIWISCPDEIDDDDDDDDDDEEEEEEEEDHGEKFDDNDDDGGGGEEEENEEETMPGEEHAVYHPNSTSSSSSTASSDKHLHQPSSRSRNHSHSHSHRNKSIRRSSSSSCKSSGEVDHPLSHEELCICERYDQLKYRFARAHYVLIFISIDSVSVISRGVPTVFLSQLCQR